MNAKLLFSLDGAKALVTGGGRGIGRAIAIGLAEVGADVAVAVGTHMDEAQSTVEEIVSRGGRAIAIQADVSEPAQVQEMIQKAVDGLGDLDVLINNAGINKHGPAEQYAFADWQRIIRVDLTGVFLCSQEAAAKVMIPKKSGRIVNVSSICADVVNKGVKQAAYHAAKAGVVMLTRALALEWAEHNIRVNCLSPGMTRTYQVDTYFEEDPQGHQLVLDCTPMRRVAEPEEMVGPVIFLASEASSFMTGQNVVVDGGYVSW